MKILIIGNGAREYALGLALSNDSRVAQLYFAPGNGATETLGKNLIASSYDELLNIAQDIPISLVIVGPEAPLLAGVSDLFTQAGFLVFGPSQQAAILEGSKAFMKDFAKRHNLPTARFIQTSDLNEALDFANTLGYPAVIKADGLCAGKGVVIAQNAKEARETLESMLSGEAFGEAGKRVVVEEYLEGFELSVFAVCDSEDFVLFPAAQDHKRLLSGNKGPNTGGMGAYAPAPAATPEIMDTISRTIIAPTLAGMRQEKRAFTGVLFAGIMVVDSKPYLLEFNVRFGDPECEVLLPLLQTPLLDVLTACAQGNLKNLDVRFSQQSAVCVVLATAEYPYSSPKPVVITFDPPSPQGAHLCFAGVSRSGEDLLATGGRVIACVGVADSLKEARNSAYSLCKSVRFSGKQMRDDIAQWALQ